MKCIYCNTEIGQDARFCPNCGKAQPCYGNKSSSKLWIWVVVGLFLLFGLLIGSGGILYLLNNKGFFSHKMTEAQTVPDTTVVADNTVDVELKSPPSVQRLGVLFSDMAEGKKSALKDYGFTLIDKKTKKEVSEYEDDDSEYVVIKEVYTLHYNTTTGDKTMTATYVYADSYGEPSMIIECDTDTWENLKKEAKGTLKHSGDNSFFLNKYSFMSFDSKGIIEIITECSISW